jgi:hypothetical protein
MVVSVAALVGLAVLTNPIDARVGCRGAFFKARGDRERLDSKWTAMPSLAPRCRDETSWLRNLEMVAATEISTLVVSDSVKMRTPYTDEQDSSNGITVR